MELIRISNRKLKIMLTPMDMCHFEINADNFTEDRKKMHRAFRLLLDEIRKQTDFDADDTHLSVQYFPSREGGCEMFISHLQDGEAEPSSHSLEIGTTSCTASQPTMQLRPFKKRSENFRRDCAYRFKSLQHLLSACNRLLQIDYSCGSEAYRDEHHNYFLFLTVFSHSAFSIPEELDFMVEYGCIENASLLRIYIREHAQTICESGAIQKLGNLI